MGVEGMKENERERESGATGFVDECNTRVGAAYE